MSPRFRVERERTDHGLGPTWVVLTPRGIVCVVTTSWHDAITSAHLLAYNY
jgi:hypothetical protein